MLLHGVYDATQVAYLAYQVRSQGVDAAIEHSSTPEAIGGDTLILLGIGVVLLVAGWYLLTRGRGETAKIAK
jgi:hypothetical protein